VIYINPLIERFIKCIQELDIKEASLLLKNDDIEYTEEFLKKIIAEDFRFKSAKIVNSHQVIVYNQNSNMSITIEAERDIISIVCKRATPIDQYKAFASLPISRFGFPISGRSRIVWGGSGEDNNHHWSIASQKWAYDIVGIDSRGRVFQNLGADNIDYAGFGRPIINSNVGIVVDLVDGIADNRPGYTNPYLALGNYIIVQHTSNIYSHFYHLKKGSIGVKVGDHLLKGVILGECGNSGQSTAPHLHFQLHTGISLIIGKSVPIQFESSIRINNGLTKPRSLRRHDIIDI
jgi:murein DD-endopeptidase MepM/ murein hydrolase activator NlpD